jgi:hypothetical protein
MFIIKNLEFRTWLNTAQEETYLFEMLAFDHFHTMHQTSWFEALFWLKYIWCLRRAATFQHLKPFITSQE